MFTPRRIYEQELLDAGEGTDHEVARNLNDMRRVNRFLGGTRVILRAIEEVLGQARPGTEFSLLDIGTGSADIPSAVSRWARTKGFTARVTGMDISTRNLRIARAELGVSRDVNLVLGDALKPPFLDRSFDLVSASGFLHHFTEDEIQTILSEFARVARKAILVNDLVRNMIPYYFMRAAGHIMTTSKLTRADGPTSVLRGFTTGEMEDLARRSGLMRFRVEKVFPYRISMLAVLE